jgi:hypothetical protein
MPLIEPFKRRSKKPQIPVRSDASDASESDESLPFGWLWYPSAELEKISGTSQHDTHAEDPADA